MTTNERSDVAEAALAAMKAALHTSRHLLGTETGLDAALWDGNDLPVDERERLLHHLSTGHYYTEEDERLHLGEPPILADGLTHVEIQKTLRNAFPHCVVVGEEARTDAWDSAQHSPENALIFQVDAIDGSVPYESLTFGYSVNILAYRREAEIDRLIFAGVANSSGIVALLDEDVAWAGTFDVLTPTTAPKATDDYRTDSVAVLGALPRHRRLAMNLFTDESLTVFSTGGAPASLGLIVGKLAAIVATKPQTLHDAAFLPILAYLGIPIFVDNGRILHENDIRRFFGRVARSQKDRISHPVPRFVAARNPAFGGLLARRVFGS